MGGALFQAGGYTMPFAVMGSCLFLSAVMTAFVLPEHPEAEVEAKDGGTVQLSREGIKSLMNYLQEAFFKS